LIALSACDVWIHEKALFKILRLPRGDCYGFCDYLSAIIQGIEQGFWGSKQSILIRCNHTISAFTIENSGNRISYQWYGRAEVFVGGWLDDKAVTNQPRWFKIRTTLCDINTQQKIVDDLLGECAGLSDDTLERCQNNSYKFYIGDEDGGFSQYDVPTIAFKYIHVL
jgi:hypothetical protein